MIPVEKFGTREYPLRPSSLHKLVKCPMSVLIPFFFVNDGEGRPGAQTGSLVHAGVEAFHRADGSAIAAREAMAEAVATFPEGDRDKAARWLDAYVADPTNQSAAVVCNEQKVELDFEGMFVRGTLDQVRRNDDGTLVVWDLKTGTSLQADDVVAEYQFQQAAYVLAARQTLNLPVGPGGIIFAAGYDKPRGRRFLPMGVRVEDCEQLMREVVREVQHIRSGGRAYRPAADHCKWCDYKPYPQCKSHGNVLGESK